MVNIQKASSRPKLIIGLHLPIVSGNNKALATLTAKAHFTRTSKSGRLASFQRAIGPMPIRKSAGVISGTNTLSKYGGPTEILPRSSASRNNGYSVPSSTEPAATNKNTLLVSSIDSRDTNLKPPPSPTLGARQANKASELPITTTRKVRIKMPRRGSVANACTEVSTPERTRKVPIRLRLKAQIASNTVQLLKPPRFSVTASECISAVPTSHGMKDAFSTGSQNHQPPQPNS